MTAFILLMAGLLLLAVFFLLLPIITTSSSSLQRPKNLFFITSISLLFLLIFSIAWYFYWGSSQALSKSIQEQEKIASVKEMLSKFKNTEALIQRLKTKINENANDPKGWYLLGRLELSRGNFKEATLAFAKANVLKPQDLLIMSSYAEALFFQNKQQLGKNAKNLIDQILKQDPKNKTALNLLALDAYTHQNYARAISIWKELLTEYSSDSQESQVIQRAIDEARKKEQGLSQ